MVTRDASALALLFGVCSLVSAAEETLPRAAIARRAKGAVVLVDLKPIYGTAFCVHASGLFVTNDHVVRQATSNVKLVLRSGLKGQKVLKARVLRRDPELDLALLRAETDEKLDALELGSDRELDELTELIALGFPYGPVLATQSEYPAISINSGSVTSLRHDKKGELHRIQLDAAVNPGSSGGPVLDRNGKVVGIVVSGIRGSGVNLAIPVSHLQRFLARPEIVVTMPSVKVSSQHEDREVTAQAVSVLPSSQRIDLELILDAGSGKERRIPMTLADGVYRARFVAVARREGPTLYRVEVQLADATVKGMTRDQTFRVGDRELKLSQLRRLRPGPRPEAELADGTGVAGALADLEAISMKLGQQTVRLALADMEELKVEQPEEVSEVPYRVVARQQGREVAHVANTLVIEGAGKTKAHRAARGPKIRIPDEPVTGTLLGANFTPTTIQLQNTGISLRSGQDNMHIFLNNLRPGKDVYEYSPDNPQVKNWPAIHVHVLSATPPRLQVFTTGYTLRVEFGKEKEGKIPCKLYLSLPDENHSLVSGSFTIDAD